MLCNLDCVLLGVSVCTPLELGDPFLHALASCFRIGYHADDVVHVLEVSMAHHLIDTGSHRDLTVPAEQMSSLICEHLWLLLHERFVFDVDELLCQSDLVTARWIAALVGVGSVQETVNHEMINVIQSQLLNAFRVGSQDHRGVLPTKSLRTHEELVAWLRPATKDGLANASHGGVCHRSDALHNASHALVVVLPSLDIETIILIRHDDRSLSSNTSEGNGF